jgi:hypothetical protein
MKRATYKEISIFIFSAFLPFMGCEDLIDIPPPETEIVREAVFENDNTALSAMAGTYNKLVNSSSSISGIFLMEGVYADELVTYAGPAFPTVPFYTNTVAPANATVSSMWASCYNIIHSANTVIEGLQDSEGVSEVVRNQLSGEALFIRAFVHFYLVNLFGDVPYVSATDYEVNAKVSRLPVGEVYEKIINDLLQAKDMLMSDYPTGNRVRVNKHSATALLARAYLYNHDWLNAEAQASELINNSVQYSLEMTDLNKSFLKESNEIIWQLIPPYGHTYEGQVLILTAPPTNGIALTNGVIMAFESGDLRKENWTDSIMSPSGLTKWFFAHKYKVKFEDTETEYSVVMRLSEQYLIRAEARAMQNKLIGLNSAESDINIVRARAGLTGTTAVLQSELLTAIEKERRVELFTEWGHRFFDLKRWGRLDAVLDPVKPNWDTTDALLPIPQSEILANPRLKQNPGY